MEGLEWFPIESNKAEWLERSFEEEEVKGQVVTSLYEILAKVLALRLGEVLDETISLCHGAFIRERQILDLVLVANEVEEYRLKEKGRSGV